MAGNVIFGGLIGAGVDAATGAMDSHKPNPLVVQLVAEKPGVHASTKQTQGVKTAGPT